MKKRKIKAIIFDMDGVLVDAREWHYEALNRALGLFGFTISRYDHLVTYDGLPTRIKLKMLSKERGLPVGLHSFINRVKQIYTAEVVFARCKPTFYHQYALSALSGKGLRLAMASNSVRQTVDLMSNKCNIDRFFEFTLSNEDVNYPKPHSEIYDIAISRLGLSPDECMVVEDNQNGIKSATDAGARVMVVKSVEEVNIQNIEKHLIRFESGDVA
ncbi:MAG: HAD family phosphatase [Deltaproteobacteria bacterium]|nr:HAD family phosphatase [Deltaproteobacteria bacterium]